MPRLGIATAALIALLPAAGAADATLADMDALATAMELCFLDTGYYTTIENLDDTSFPNPGSPHQFIDEGGGALVILPTEGDFRAARLNLVTAPLPWMGPYLAVQGGRFDIPPSDYDPYTILDFFGTPYYFYTPLGLVDPVAEEVNLRYYGDAFDRYVIVSHGPDGLMSDDDIIWEFGGGVTVPAVSAAAYEQATGRGGAVPFEIRGYVLGATQGSGQVLVDGAPSVDVQVTSWTPTRIEGTFAALPPDGTAISVQTNGGATTRSVPLAPQSGPTAVADWSAY